MSAASREVVVGDQGPDGDDSVGSGVGRRTGPDPRCDSQYHRNYPKGDECQKCRNRWWVRRLAELDMATRAGAEALWANYVSRYSGLRYLNRLPTLDEAAAGWLDFTQSFAIGEARGCVSRAAIVLEAVAALRPELDDEGFCPHSLPGGMGCSECPR